MFLYETVKQTIMKTRSSLFIVLVSLLSIYVCSAQQPYVAKLDSLIELIRNNDKGMGSISVFKDGKKSMEMHMDLPT